MTIDRRSLILAGLMAAALTTGTVWAYTFLVDSRAAAATAAADLAECRRLAAAIEALRCRGPQEGSHEPRLDQLVGRIEQSAESAHIPPDSLVRVSPEPARRVADTPYKQKHTQVHLQRVTLQQLITFLHSLTATDLGLRVSTLRLTASPHPDTGRVWTVQTTLTDTIYQQ